MALKAVLQKSINDCGLACLAIIAGHFKRPLILEVVASLLPLQDWQDGASMKQLAELARKMGFSTQAVKCNISSLHKLPLPCIAHLAHNHYVVVAGVSSKEVRFLDPRYGRAMLSLREFEQLCSGLFLIFGEADTGNKSLQDARFLHQHLLSQDPWVRAYRRIFIKELGQLLPFAAGYGGAVILSLSFWMYWAVNRSALRPETLIAHGLLVLGILLLRVIFLEHYLLKRYTSLTRALGEQCLHKSHYFYQYAGSSKLLDRYRWVVEFIYTQRYAIWAALQIFSSLLLTMLVTLLFRQWWAAFFCAAFGLAIVLEVKGHLSAVEQSECRYYQRMLVQRMLGSYANGQPASKLSPATAANGNVNFRSPNWWLPALASYLPVAVVVAALWWAVRDGLSNIHFPRSFSLVALIVCFVLWYFVKGQLTGFTAIASGLQELSFMSFMKQLSDPANLPKPNGKE